MCSVESTSGWPAFWDRCLRGQGSWGPSTRLKKKKKENWRGTEMNKPLKWLQRKNISINQVCVCWYVVQLHMLKPELQMCLNYCSIGLGGVNTHWKQSSLDVDMLHASSLCSLRSPSTLLLCSDMFFSPSPKFPSFRERSEVRDSDLPRGWVKDSPPPSPPWEMFCSPHFFILYTPESLILPWLTWQCVERAAISGFWLYFRLFGWIDKCPAASCVESLCVKMKEKNPQGSEMWLTALVWNWKMT